MFVCSLIYWIDAQIPLKTFYVDPGSFYVGNSKSRIFWPNTISNEFLWRDTGQNTIIIETSHEHRSTGIPRVAEGEERRKTRGEWSQLK